MLQEGNGKMKVTIRKFERRDIENKVKWINESLNNKYLHYELPLEYEKTEKWFEKNKDRTDRYDAIIEADGISVGIIGLLSIDNKNRKAEYYITIGERSYLGKGIALSASKLLLEYGFHHLGLNRIYLYTETDNVAAVKLYERIGFKREGVIKSDLYSRGRFVDRYIYGITRNEFFRSENTPIYYIDEINGNSIYIKRDDLIPFSFGGNKARKAKLFFEKIDRENYDYVVTYGSSSSNHCRVVSNLAAKRGMKCCIIEPVEKSELTFNSKMIEVFGAEIVKCPVDLVHDTIEKKLSALRSEGFKPFFIQGGGHGNTGTQAYVDCYNEICQYEKDNKIHFDYVFHASGTGTTQAGLVCGQMINRDARKIIGISIARKNPRGRAVVIDSIKEYLGNAEHIEENTIFIDDYTGNGYGTENEEIRETIVEMMVKHGIPLDATYTGKAFWGMKDYLRKKDISKKNILFIHTGGTPLFFDFLRSTQV